MEKKKNKNLETDHHQSLKEIQAEMIISHDFCRYSR